MARRQRRMRTVDDDGESLYRKQGGVGAWWLQREISIAFPEIEQERGLIEFGWNLSYRLSDGPVCLLPGILVYVSIKIYIYSDES